MVSFSGLAMLLVGVGYKLAWVPFHMWSPDVYQGAPAPVTALIASGSKGAVFALLLRLTAEAGLRGHGSAFLALAVLATATMFVGNLLALSENNVKRLLAYSSVAQMGYLLIPVLASGARGVPSATFYLVSYLAAAIAAFGVIAVVSARRETGDVEQLRDYVGFSTANPVLAAVFALSLLSLTGMPLTAGFFAKFYIFTAAADRRLWWLLIVGVVNTGMSAFYYLKVVFALYAHRQTSDHPVPGTSFTPAICLAACTAAIIVFGIYPTPLIRLAEAAARALAH
jgi:NADH-quinone oxidoreductase subunit N